MDNEIIPAPAPETGTDKLVDLGKWIGRHQALAWVVSHCSAADAHSLLTIRERKLYRALGITWEEFCLQHAGVSARTAERIIASLKEFGDSYFNLTEIVQIPAPAYRAIQPAIEDNTLEFEGQRIPINRENTRQLAQAVQTLRARLEKAEQRPPRSALSDLQTQFDRAIGQLSGIFRRGEEFDRQVLTTLVQEHICRIVDTFREAGYTVVVQDPGSRAA
jgi:hypothetical protein